MDIIKNLIMEYYNELATIGVGTVFVTMVSVLYIMGYLVKKELVKCIRKIVKRYRRKGS